MDGFLRPDKTESVTSPSRTGEKTLACSNFPLPLLRGDQQTLQKPFRGKSNSDLHRRRCLPGETTGGRRARAAPHAASRNAGAASVRAPVDQASADSSEGNGSMAAP